MWIASSLILMFADISLGLSVDTCNSKKTIFWPDSNKQLILDLHNDLRRKVAKGQESRGKYGRGQPGAANMKKLVWNHDLADSAQKLVDQCVYRHDRSGQNIGLNGKSQPITQDDIKGLIKERIYSWYNEVKDFDPNHISPYKYTKTPKIGHYTQMVWADTEEIGCAISHYKGTRWADTPWETFMVCNYAVKGNIEGGTMYKTGRAGSDCPAGYSSDDGLCYNSVDCGKKCEGNKWFESRLDSSGDCTGPQIWFGKRRTCSECTTLYGEYKGKDWCRGECVWRNNGCHLK